MKILMLTPYLPYPPSSGGQVRSYNLIKHIGKKHQIYLVALIKTDGDKKNIEYLKKYCRKIYVCRRSKSPWTINNILKSVLGPLPFLVVRNFSPEAKKTVSELIKTENFDLIHAETFYIMPHIPETTIPILLVEQTIEYKVYQHYIDNLRFPILPQILKLDILKLQYWEKAYWKKADLVGAVSEEDKKSMRSLVPGLKIRIIPNAAGDDLLNIYSENKTVGKPVFFYLGNYLWLQNVEAASILAKHVFPEIKKIYKDATCIIAGQHADEKIKDLDNNSISVINVIDATLENPKLYKQSSIFIAPIKGPGGTRLKILGAMAAGIPVISSPTGVSGLNVTDNKDVLIARSPREFAQKAVEILRSPKKYKLIKKNARKLVEREYVYKSIAKRLEHVYRKLI